MRPGSLALACLLVVVALVSPGTPGADPKPAGGMRGNVQDRDFGGPLGGVRVSIVEALMSTLSTDDGTFSFTDVPPGRYSVSFRKEGYEREVVTDVVVVAGQMRDVQVELSGEIFEMDEMIVSGLGFLGDSEIGLMELRADTVNLQDSISTELFSKAGVSDAAGALKLVVGASVVDGKYATVRGLSDRYTGTTLNGVRVPSADPRRRAVQIDLFPTGTIESVTVTKTFTPDLQGEFTGGGVDIKTKSIPDGPILEVGLSTEYDAQATGNERFLTYLGGGVNATGFDLDRGVPGPAQLDPLPPPAFSPRPTEEQLELSADYDRLTRSFAPTMGTTRAAPGANYGLSVVAGNRHGFSSGQELGVIAALTYSRKFDYYDKGVNNQGAVSDRGAPITFTQARSDQKGSEELLIGILGNLVYRPGPKHEYSLRLIANRSAQDEARIQVQDVSETVVEQNQVLQYSERNVSSTQAHGDHGFGRFHAKWFGAFNRTRQREPDVRFFRNIYDAATMSGRVPANSTDALNSRRIFRDILEDNAQGGVDFEIPFTQWTQSEGKVKTGAYFDRTNRDYEQVSFTYTFPTQLGSFLNAARACNLSAATFNAEYPGQLWTDVFLRADRIGLAPEVPDCSFNPTGVPTPAPNQLLWIIKPLGNDVNYSGDSTIDAIYAMAEVPLSARFRLIGGARYERTEISIEPTTMRACQSLDADSCVEVIDVQPSGDRAIIEVTPESVRASLQKSLLLPSFGVIWEVVPDLNLRASWGRTLARPTMRELAPVATEEFIFGDEFIGNPELTLSTITNYDLRFEWFPRPGDVLALSGFSKNLTDPIELLSFGASNRSFIQPVNFERGKVAGIEFEARSNLDILSERLRGLSVGLNYTLINSEVEVPIEERLSLVPYALDEQRRRLQGQPAYLLNGNVSYDNDAIGLSASLFFNRIGETLLSGAARGTEDGTPNVFEEPYSSLDLRVNKKFVKARDFSLTVKAQNLLQADRERTYRTPYGSEAIKSSRESSIRYSLAAAFKW